MTVFTTRERKEEIEIELLHLQKEKEVLLTEANQLKDTLDLSVKEREKLLRDFEELRESSSSADNEFAAYKTAKEAVIIDITKEQEELLESRNQLQVS